MRDHPMVREATGKRHWDSASEGYTGGDSLATTLQNGWIPRKIFNETNCCPTHRSVTVYHFELTRGDEMAVMLVVRNPWVERLIDTIDFAVHPLTVQAESNQSDQQLLRELSR
jgi:hypothetical protein